MKHLIGADEAGYGPNLGPLVIAVSHWQVADDLTPEEFPVRLASVLRGAHSRDDPTSVWVVADSKRLYKPGGGLTLLEHGVLVAMRLLEGLPPTWREIWRRLAADTPADDLLEAPWHVAYDERLPIEADEASVVAAAAKAADGLNAASARLHSLAARAIFPGEWNRLLELEGSKSAVLSLQTLELVFRALRGIDRGDVVVVCDKHGARDRYAGLLQQHVATWIEVVRESAELSVYRWRDGALRIEIRFQPKGESFPPAALASMTAKYLRELAMRAFNRFWLGEVAGLKPTAGYPVDARRFHAEIAASQARLGIADERLWRNR